MAIQHSYKNKIVDIGINEGTMTADDGRKVDYKTLVLEIEVDGKIETINLSGASAPKPGLLNILLRSATEQNGSFLGNSEL